MLELSRNHFELLGLPVAFELDPALLAERYHDLQRVLHPDRFAAAGERERRLSVEASARINDAHQTLRDPLARARYLLELLTGEHSGGAVGSADPAFLMEQMELRETLAGARDRADPAAAVADVLARLERQATDLSAALGARFAAPTADNLAAAGALVQQLQFVFRARAEAERLEAELDGSAWG